MLTLRCASRLVADFATKKTDCYDTILAQNHIAPSSRPRTVIFGILVGYDIKYTPFEFAIALSWMRSGPL